MKEIETLEKKFDSDEENPAENPMDVSNRHSISSSDSDELVDQDHFNQSLDPDEPANCSIDSQNFLNL